MPVLRSCVRDCRNLSVAEVETLLQSPWHEHRLLALLILVDRFEKGDEVAVIVSGLGATPVMELYILYNKIEELLAEKGIKVYKPFVGNYFTSLEMMGATFTAMRLDDELKALLDMPCESMGVTVTQK